MENGQSMNIFGIGTCDLDFGSDPTLPLPEFLYASGIIYDMLNICKLTLHNIKIPFKGTKIYAMSQFFGLN